MRERISQCNVLYESWQMQCCGDPISVGRIVNLPCIKKEPYTCACGIHIDFDEDHHGSPNCLIRGRVVRIQTVFVDHFAKTDDDTRYIDDPNNTFAIIEVYSIDGWEEPVCYEHRKGGNASYYIITIENAVECVLESHEQYPLYQGLYVNMEPDDESMNLFWNEGGSIMGTVNELSIYKGKKSQTIDLISYRWHNDLLAWHKFFQENIRAGYNELTNLEWLKWWSKGWGLAKEIRKILPADIELNYGHISQANQVLDGTDLNTESFMISFPKHMTNRINEGLFIPNVSIDWQMDDDKNNNYNFQLNGVEHDFHPDDRVMLGVIGRSHYQLGTILSCHSDELVIHTDWSLDISECYSIELII